MCIYDVKGIVPKLHTLAVHHVQISVMTTLLKILASQIDGRLRKVNARNVCALARKSQQVNSNPTSNFQHVPSFVSGEIHQARQVIEFVIAIFLQFLEELLSAYRMGQNRKVVDMFIPIISDPFNLFFIVYQVQE